MIRVEKYSINNKKKWDDFIFGALNGHFMFFRDYMDYHCDRFPDNSLEFYNDDTLIAVLPASIQNKSLVSHPGLTFGGLIFNKRNSLLKTIEIVKQIIGFCKENGMEEFVYKAIPWIYYPFPLQDDIFALTFNGAGLVRRDISATIDHLTNPAISKGRKHSLKKAEQHEITISESKDYETFINLLTELLINRHNTKPVHSASEMQLLSDRFPDNIKLFLGKINDETLAGVVVFESKFVAHSQYIGATERGKSLGALDLLLNYLIYDRYKDKRFFDFGISTWSNGEKLNEGLVINKESYGASGIVHDFYKLVIK